MKLSIIIPTLNEANNIGRLIKYLKENTNGEVCDLIVCDGGSEDETVRVAKKSGAKVVVCDKGRACQMNKGFENSKGDVLYFLHADTIPPKSFINDIQNALNDKFPVGCFRFKFDSTKKILKFNSYMTRFDKLFCRGGDQSLFIQRNVFEDLNGFRDDYKIMEEYDLIQRAKEKYSFKVIQKDVLVSARKYEGRSWLRVMFANGVVYNMYRFGASQEAMIKMYRKLLG